VVVPLFRRCWCYHQQPSAFPPFAVVGVITNNSLLLPPFAVVGVITNNSLLLPPFAVVGVITHNPLLFADVSIITHIPALNIPCFLITAMVAGDNTGNGKNHIPR